MERLKQKVASSSSRVIASIQQATGGSFLATAGQQVVGPADAPPPPPTQPAQPAGEPGQPVPEAAMSTAWLMAADATAHLTEEEREILLEVFKKEEQFQRDTIKQMTRVAGQASSCDLAASSSSSTTTATGSASNNNLNDQEQQQQQQTSSNYGARSATSSSSSQGQGRKPSALGTHAFQQQTGGYRRPLSSAGSSPRPASSAALSSCSPAGSSAAATPSRQRNDSKPEQRQRQQQQKQQQHQCRICRKLIGANEPVHLCSNCQQFICDDCASYSANDQHWMCSSCRRRALNPAIPADALKELGLNQNSSAVRRMTLRLNQNELKIALKKSSSESNTSSNSSSGCSSMSSGQAMAPPTAITTTAPSTATRISARQVSRPRSAKQTPPPLQSSRQETPTTTLTSAELSRPSGSLAGRASTEPALGQQSEVEAAGATKTKAFQSRSQPNQRELGRQQQQQQQQQAPPDQQPQQQTSTSSDQSADSQSIRQTFGGATSYLHGSPERLGAHKTMSGPMNWPQVSPLAAGPHRQRAGQQVAPGVESKRQHDSYEPTQTTTTAATMSQSQQQQVSRRASVNVAEQVAARSLGQKSVSPITSRKMSSSGGTQVSPASANRLLAGHRNSVAYGRPQPAPMITGTDQQPTSIQWQQQQQPNHQQQPVNVGSNLIQIPPEQVHMRRLSDQSNLIRRSSIIADNLTDGLLIVRNRSHSNIDTASANLIYQSTASRVAQQHRMSTGGLSHGLQSLQYSASNVNSSFSSGLPTAAGHLQLPAHQQHRRLSDQYDQQQRLNQLQLSSIVTSCAQKRRSSSEELNSNSSSDIDDDQEALAMMQHQQQQQQHSYSGLVAGSAPNYNNVQSYSFQKQLPAGAAYGSQREHQDNYLEQEHHDQQQPINIPSVSVSEFHVANQRRASMAQQQLNHNNHQHQLSGLPGHQEDDKQLLYQQDNQITPMQINVAIEQVIQQQQQREQLAPNTAAFLAGQQRRGSSGRILPKVPVEQSRSLLDLPLGQATNTGGSSAPSAGQANGAESAAGYMGHAQTMLDLPSPTIRRASAPEGQNIKIVVDDMDASSFRAHSAAGKAGKRAGVSVGGLGTGGTGGLAGAGELLERVVLYRDDSLDLANNNVGRGFGLQVMGGKMAAPVAVSAAALTDADHHPQQPEHWMKLHACISWVLPGGPADKVGLRPGDKIIEWDGKCLLDMSYEQVAEVIESSANIAELLIRPAQRLDPQPAGAHYVRSQRRLSQQTERDLRRFHEQQQQQQQPSIPLYHQNGHHQQHCQQQEHQRTGTGRRLPKIPGQQQAQQHSTAVLLPENFVPVRHASTGQLEHTGQYLAQFGPTMNGSGGGGVSIASRNQLGAVHDHQSRSATELHGPTCGPPQQALLGGYPQQVRSANTSSSAINLWPHQNAQQHPQQQQMNYYNSQHLHPTPMPGHQVLSTSAGLMAANAVDEICGLIGLQVNVDEHINQLEISILSAINIERNPSLDHIVRVRILPESNQFKPCKTQPSSDMNWKETFIFQNFPTQQVHRMALEIGIWVHEEAPRLTTQIAQAICEALIPIQSARERNTDFWPLRPPPSSPQTRRKSLNDLMGTGANYANQQPGPPQTMNDQVGSRLAARYQQTSSSNQRSMANSHQSQGVVAPAANPTRRCDPKRGPMSSISPSDSPIKSSGQYYTRERSASNRNLPDTSKLQVQPRRASDEMAASSSHRLMARISPAASRRSISVINVGDGFQRSRQGSQSGSLAKVAQMRRDSQAQLQQLQHQKQQMTSGSAGSGRGSPTAIKYNTPTSGGSRASDSQTPVVGVTPSGRRSSLVGIQSMTGYRSQKNSQSDATDHESPLNSMAGQKRSRESSLVASQQILTDQKQQQQQNRQPCSATNSGYPSCSSQSGSRRGSSTNTEPVGVAQLQRRGSFAMQTLRKLKRTMSLTKGGQDSQSGSNQDSRRSSSSSNNSSSEPAEDLALSRSTKPDTESVGRLKLSFIMTKGQFEVEVICAQGLKFDSNQAIGIYVKMYLKAKKKSNKRKTNIVQPWESPVFKQTIKYDASLVDNKLLEVSVWVKQGGLRGQLPIGTTEIRLADLNLTQLQTSWYNLRSMDSLCSSSIED